MNDPVERDDVIDAICNKCMLDHKMERRMPTLCRNCRTVKMIQAILSADRPQGERIPNSPFTGNCSECGADGNLKDNYCSNCGARIFAKDINVPNKKGADDGADNI